jgi:hypothetical protein
MRTGFEKSFRPGSLVWVWDSLWLPAVLVNPIAMDRWLVRLDHGVTFSATTADLVARDPARLGSDIPSANSHLGRSEQMHSKRQTAVENSCTTSRNLVTRSSAR